MSHIYLIILISFGGLTGDIRYEQKVPTFRDCTIAADAIMQNPCKFYRYEETYEYNAIKAWCVNGPREIKPKEEHN